MKHEIKIVFKNKKQAKIAGLLWAAETIAEADAIVKAGGIDAVVVREMIIAHSVDVFLEDMIAESEESALMDANELIEGIRSL